MSKMSLEWHRTCLVNMEVNLQAETESLEFRKLRVQMLKDSIELYRKQIALAEARGKDSFDRDRLGIKRGKL